MDEKELRDFMEKRAKGLLDHYKSSQAKYDEIWGIYAKQMPGCVEHCTKETDIDGPQGIYWIGANPRILFVGREHYGWYGESDFNSVEGRHAICYSPLEFAYYTIPSMGSYWAIVKELARDVLEIGLDDWDEILKNVALTNACKCLPESGNYQGFLHQQCKAQNYLRHEVLTIDAPLNVLFTKQYGLAREIFQDIAEPMEDCEDFFVQKIDNKIVIECAHPGRQSHEWRANLKDLMTKYLS